MLFTQAEAQKPQLEDLTTSLVPTMLVLGAADDGMVTNAEVRATARAYATHAEFFPGMGHNMMLEPEWAGVAERIHAWLQARDLG